MSEKTLQKDSDAKALKVLFVCEGNIGRSQMAESFFNELAGGKVTAESAGVSEVSIRLSGIAVKHISSNLVRYMKEAGRDVSNNKIKNITQKMFDDADVVVFMVNGMDNVPAYAQNSSKVIFWEVKDPRGLPHDEFRRTRDGIKGLVKELFDARISKLLRSSDC